MHSQEVGAGMQRLSPWLLDSCMHSCRRSEFLVAVYVVMKVMAIIKGITIKLQKRVLDECRAYTMADGVIWGLEQVRNDPTVFTQRFQQIESLAECAGQTITIPRISGWQVRRTYYASQDPREYYRVSVRNLDHVISHRHDRFDAAQQQSVNCCF